MSTTSDWSRNTRWDEVCRRASGRRRYNAVRRLHAELRRNAIIKRAWELGTWLRERGFQAALARQFGVNRSTISRDVKQLERDMAPLKPCPLCGRAFFGR